MVHTERITVIPMTNEALRSVRTPFVTFEQPFSAMAARLERQLLAMGRNTAAVILGDTWPDAYHDPLSWGRSSKLLGNYHLPRDRYDQSLWPETAIYNTNVARLFAIDESVRYRPQMHFFCRYYDSCSPMIRFGDDMELSPEAAIVVPDRNIYEVAYPKLTLLPVDRKLSILRIGAGSIDELLADRVLLNAAQIVTVSDDDSIPLGLRFNRAVEQTTGEYIAVVDVNYKSRDMRLSIQLDDDVDLSMGALTTDSGVEAWVPYGFMHETDTPTGQLATMMFRRRVFEQLGGACTDLSHGFEYDLFVRILGARNLTMAYHSDALAAGSSYVCAAGKTYLQQVYNDAANRIRLTKGYHVCTIRKR